MVFLLGVIALVMLLQIIMRYVFRTPLDWAEELCRQCFIYSGLIGIAFCSKKDILIRMDALILVLPEKIRKIWLTIVDFVLIAFFAYLFYQSILLIRLSMEQGQSTPALKIPATVTYFSLALGFGLAAIRTLQNVLRKVCQRSHKKEVES